LQENTKLLRLGNGGLGDSLPGQELTYVALLIEEPSEPRSLNTLRGHLSWPQARRVKMAKGSLRMEIPRSQGQQGIHQDKQGFIDDKLHFLVLGEEPKKLLTKGLAGFIFKSRSFTNHKATVFAMKICSGLNEVAKPCSAISVFATNSFLHSIFNILLHNRFHSKFSILHSQFC